MLILYTKDNCVYCEKVKRAFKEHNISYEERNISNPLYLKDVQSRGARSMPYLVDTTANVQMGESDEIIAYALEGSF
jgi:glutaredoxin-like protein NrdH